MSRDYEPQAGQWYEDLDNEEAFQVLSVDPDEEIIRIQWPDREIREIDLDQWNEMDLELTIPPEGWVDDVVEDDEEDDDLDEDDETRTTTGTMTRTTTSTKTTTNTAIASDAASRTSSRRS